MPAPPQGNVEYPGLNNIQMASFTFSHGIKPSVCNVRAVVGNQNLVEKPQTLTLSYGGQQLQFKDCWIKTITLNNVESGGQTMNVAIMDRRWKWQYGEVTGTFNKQTKRGDDTIIENTKATPRKMATLFLMRMGEKNFDVTFMPDENPGPEMLMDRANPAEMLQRLCEQTGHIVVLMFDGSVKIMSVSDVILPQNVPFNDVAQVISDTYSSVGPPSQMLGVTGPIEYQMKFKLEAVGLETDGTIVPIKELSYKPKDEWRQQDPKFFGDVSENFIDVNKSRITYRDLALQTVWRWYRIVSTCDGSNRLPKQPQYADFSILGDGVNHEKEDFGIEGDITFLSQLRWLPNLLDDNDFKNDVEERPYRINGIWAPQDQHDGIAAPDTEYNGRYSFDTKRNIVMFSEPVFQYNRLVYEEAELYFTGAFQCYDPKAHVIKRATSKVGFVRFGHHGPAISHHNEMIPRYVQTYKGIQRTIPDEVISNQQYLIMHLTSAANKELSQITWAGNKSREVRYAGWVAPKMDSGLRQITWTTNSGGAITQVGYNVEHNRIQDVYEDKKAKILQSALDNDNKLQAQVHAREARQPDKKPVPGRIV